MIISSDYLKQMQRMRRRTRFLMALIISGVVLVGAYFVYQTRDWVLFPELTVSLPLDGATLPGPAVVIEGMVTPGIRLTVHGVDVYSEKNGKFHIELLMSAGLHTIHIVAENRFGRARSVERRIVVKEGTRN